MHVKREGDSERSPMREQVRPAPEAADLSGGEKPLHPFPVQDRRRHGHEHDLQGQCLCSFSGVK